MMEGWKETEIGLLPNDWDVYTLGECNSYRNKNINPSNYPEELFEYYSIPAYQNGQIPDITFGKDIQSNKLVLQSNCIIFGKLNPRVEKVWRVGNHSIYRKIGSTEWIVIKPKDFLDFDFIYFMEWSDYVMPIAKTLVTGSTPSRQRVSPPAFYQIKIPVPPLPEQRKIAYVLSTVQKAIEQQDKLIKTTTELKKALMQKLFTEGLYGEKQKQTEIGPVPESWEVVELGNVAVFKNGINFTKEQKGEKGIPTIDVYNMYGKSYIVDTTKLYRVNKKINEDYLLKNGDLLFVRSSLKQEGVGWTSLFVDGKEPITFCGFIIRARLLDHGLIYPPFLTYYFRTETARNNLISGSGKVAITNINQGLLNSTHIPVPSIEEQKAIVQQLELFSQKIESHRKKKQTLSDLFKTLLHELMTGQRRVHKIDFGFNFDQPKEEKKEMPMAAEPEINVNKEK